MKKILKINREELEEIVLDYFGADEIEFELDFAETCCTDPEYRVAGATIITHDEQ